MGKVKKKSGLKVLSSGQLNKKYGLALNLVASQIKEHGLHIPTRFLSFNYLVGFGLPYGKVIEFIGMESSGKTLAALDAAYCTQQLGGHVIWIDAEQCWQNSWAEQNGLNLEQVTVLSDTRIEVISDAIADLSIYLRSTLTHNEPILLVLDSVAATDCEDNINSTMVDSKADMGNRAKAIYKMLRIRNELLYKLGITQIYVNQIREKLNVGFGQMDNNTTPGGKGLAFYAAIRVAFFGGKTLTIKYKGKDRKTGRLVTIRVIKNKVAPPRATISKAPMYNNPKYHEVGFDRYFGLEDVLLELDVISKSNGGVYKYHGKVLCRGEEKFRQLLEDDPKLRRKLLEEANINTIKTTQKLIDGLEVNLFPVSDEDLEYEKHDEAEDDDDFEDEETE